MAVVRSSPRPVRVLVRALLGFVAFLVFGNATIFGASLLMQWRASAATFESTEVEGVDNLRAVDAKVWRGGHPSAEGYQGLAANGVTTIVDLRAEDDAAADHTDAEAAGLDVVHLPVRDGQIPTREEFESFLEVVEEAEGTVFLHCGAGVGRTGAMAAAYLVATGQASPSQALRRNLSVGPPSLEQIVFVGSLEGDGSSDRPGRIVTTVSRVLDAPRRLLSYL